MIFTPAFRNTLRAAALGLAALVGVAAAAPVGFGTLAPAGTAADESRRISISGQIRTEDGAPVSGASVRIKGRPIRGITDDCGQFSIEGTSGAAAALVISRRGLKSIEAPLAGEAPVTITMARTSFSSASFHILPDFHLNRFHDQDNGLRGLAECHFTVANAANPQNLELCEQLGLAVMVTEAPHLREDEWLQFSDDEIEAKIRRMVANGGSSRAIIGYYLCDEPSARSFPALAKAVAAVKRHAPGKLAYINLYPIHGTIMREGQLRSQLGTASYTEYLERYVREVQPQFICYDNYRVLTSHDLRNPELAAQYYTNLVEVRRIALGSDIPFYNIVSSCQIRPSTTIPSPANLAFQAFTSLAAGARGVQWYVYHSVGPASKYDYTPLDRNENRTPTWRYLQEVNRQLSILGPVISQLKSTGLYFTAPAAASTLPTLPGKWVKQVQSETPMLVGEFADAAGANYAMFVNLSLERSGKCLVETQIPREQAWEISAAEAGELVSCDSLTRSDLGHRNGRWLPAGQALLVKFTGTSAPP